MSARCTILDRDASAVDPVLEVHWNDRYRRNGDPKVIQVLIGLGICKIMMGFGTWANLKLKAYLKLLTLDGPENVVLLVRSDRVGRRPMDEVSD